MVVIEHDLPLLSRLRDRMVAMDLGRVIATGTPDEVRAHPAVVAPTSAPTRPPSSARAAPGDRGTRPRPAGDPIQPVTSR